MKIAFFSTKPYDRNSFLGNPRAEHFEIQFFAPRLTQQTMRLAAGFPVVCVFVNDELDRTVIQYLSEHRLNLMALRCAGFNNVDLEAANQYGVSVVRVPAYSPYAVAEHTVGLVLTLNRSIHRAYNRVREGNFSLDGLLGFDLHNRTVGAIGTGKIGERFCQIMMGFGAHVLAFDLTPNPKCVDLGVEYVKDLRSIYKRCDILSLHCPLTADTHHLIDHQSIAEMKPGVMLINTSRGGLIDTQAVINGLKSGQIGSLGIDVYEEESELFFEDLSNNVLRDDVFARLLTFPNVIVTGHQGFFTRDALEQIAKITLDNIECFHASNRCENQVSAPAKPKATVPHLPSGAMQ